MTVFWVHVEGRRWHKGHREEIRREGQPLMIGYTLGCSDEFIRSADLADIETELPAHVARYDICGHNPCARERKKR